MPIATPIIYQGLPPGSPSWANMVADMAALVGGLLALLGRGPWGRGQSPCRDGVWHLPPSFSSAHSPYHFGGIVATAGQFTQWYLGRLTPCILLLQTQVGVGARRGLLPLEGRRGSEQGGDRAWGPPWQGREVSVAPEG